MDTLLLAGSIAGVIGLAAIAWLLGLGGAAIRDEAQARRIAEEAGFVAADAFVSTDGAAALVRGADGAWLLLKVHGANIAPRILAPPVRLAATDDGVRVVTGERMFGDVRLLLPPEARDKLLTIV